MIKAILLILASIMSFVAEAKITKSHGYAIYSELKYPHDFAHFDYVNPEAPKGGELKLAHIGTFNSVNANIIKGTKAPGLDYTYDALLIKSMDELNSYYGLVAETIEYPQDLSYVIFNLRKNATWHDGSPITVDDLIFTFDILKDKGDPNYRITLADVLRVEKLSNHSIKYVFASTKREPLLIPIVGELPILHKEFFKDKAFEQHDLIYPTSGPYKIKDYSNGKYITYERVKDYWAKDLPVYKGLYNFDIINYDCYHENVIALEAFKAGAFDFRDENAASIWATSYVGKLFDEGKILKENRSHKLPASIQAYFLNMRKPELRDKTLRKALYYAYDFDWMNQNLLYKIYSRTESYFEGIEYVAKGLPDEDELVILNKFRDKLPPEMFTEEFIVPSTNSDPLINRQYLKNIKQELLDAGYKIEGERLISPITNKPIELELIYRLQGQERTILAYKENLAKIGITLIPRLIDHAQYILRSENFDFDLITLGFTPSTFPGRNLFQLWHSTSIMKGGYNFSGVNDEVVDYLLTNLVEADNKKDITTYAGVLDRVLLWNYYAVPQMHSKKYHIAYWNKFGLPDIRTDYAIGVETWWKKQY